MNSVAAAAPRSEVRRPPPAHPVARSSAPAAPLPLYARRSSEGRPLESAIRQRFEAGFQRAFTAVRLHLGAGDRIEQMAPGARAVTVGQDIFLRSSSVGRDEEPLLAHELTHVAQQERASAETLGIVSRGDGPLEAEAQRNALDYRAGRPVSVSQSAPAIGAQADEPADHGVFYRAVVHLVPQLGPILDRGVFNWIGDRVNEVAGAVMETLRAPLETIRGVERSVSTHVSQLIDWVRKCVAALMKGDCSVLHEGIEYLENIVNGLGAQALDVLKDAFKTVSDFINGLLDKYWAPLSATIGRYAGLAWQKIEQFLGWVREQIQPYIDTFMVGWNTIKGWLGVGDDPDSQNGLLQWAQRKLAALWERVKAAIEPIKRPLMVAGGILLLLSPAGPFIVAGAVLVGAVGGVIEAVRWIRRTFAAPAGVVTARQMLQRVILPRMVEAITSLAQTLADRAGFILDRLTALRENLEVAATAVGEGIASFLAAPIRFVASVVGTLVGWANEKLRDFVGWVNNTATRFSSFLLTVADALNEISRVLIDLMGIPVMLAGRLWNRIPACIRDPFVDFIGVQILGRIPIFQTIAGTPEAWARTREDVRQIIRTIFVDHDLLGAMRRAFVLFLRVLDVPLELLTAVLSKMDLAWEQLKSHPANFLKNLFRTMALALRGFFRNILTHLGHGLVGWLTIQLRGTSVQLPTSWTDLGQIFRFVASVLGLSLAHVFELMERRNVPRNVIQALRTTARVAAGALEWIALIAAGDFAAFWERVKQQLADIKNTVVNGITSWIMQNVVGAIMAQLITTADPTGISEAIMLIIDIYRTIKTVIQYARPILEMMQQGLDAIIGIANGVLQPAADLVENAMDRGMPFVIGFMVNLAGLGNVGQGIRDAIMSIRERVDNAIFWIIDRARAAINAVANLVRSAVGAVREWWRARFPTTVDGEPHTVTVHGAGESAQVFVESYPRTIEDVLAELESRPGARSAKVREIRAKLDEVNRLKTTQPMTPEAGDTIQSNLNAIADLLGQVLPEDESTEPIYGPIVGGFGSSVHVERMRRRPSYGGGPSVQDGLWEHLRRRRSGGGTYYVRGHLLNDNLGGPGNTWSNLTPLTQAANNRDAASMLHTFETPVKAWARRWNVEFTVTADYGRSHPLASRVGTMRTAGGSRAIIANIVEAEQAVPTEIHCRARPLGTGAQSETPLNVDISNAIDDQREDQYQLGGARRLKRVNLVSHDGNDRAAFEEVYGIGPSRAARLLAPGFTTFRKMENLITELGLPADIESEWQKDGHPTVALTGRTEWE